MEVFLLPPQPHRKKAPSVEKPLDESRRFLVVFSSMKDRRTGRTASNREAEGQCQDGISYCRLPHVHQRQER